MINIDRYKEQIDFMSEQLKVIKAKEGTNQQCLLIAILKSYDMEYEDFMRKDRFRKGVRARRMYMYCAYRLLDRTQRKIAEDLDMPYQMVSTNITAQHDMKSSELRKHNPQLRSDFARFTILKTVLQNAEII